MEKAVILVNLGTPDQPTSAGVRKFLREFLSDRRVVELSRWLWLPILYGIILPFRSPRVAKKYQPLWAMGDSPLRLFSQQLAERVAVRLGDRHCDVRLAMTYGSPGIAGVVDEVLSAGARELLFVPLFPQYSATTTAAVLDRVQCYFAQRRDIPQWGFVRDYHDEPAYIEALANSVRRHWAEHGRSDKLLMSFHGIPRRNVLLGDPYQQQCETTAKLLAGALALTSEQWCISYQSRLGKAEWLQPYTDKTVVRLAREGFKQLDVICPAFATECLETLEEIDTEAAELFYENGGERFSYIACLNDSDEHADLLANLAAKRIAQTFNVVPNL